LHLACALGFKECVRTLVANNANINSIDIEGNTPLHLASEAGNIGCVKGLIENGTPKIIKN
jgi:ankyrin repeat protein